MYPFDCALHDRRWLVQLDQKVANLWQNYVRFFFNVTRGYGLSYHIKKIFSLCFIIPTTVQTNSHRVIFVLTFHRINDFFSAQASFEKHWSFWTTISLKCRATLLESSQIILLHVIYRRNPSDCTYETLLWPLWFLGFWFHFLEQSFIFCNSNNLRTTLLRKQAM